MADIDTASRRKADPADSAADASTEVKKRARRRLVGATGLALLAVIVLPMVMDQEPKPTGQDIQIKIPAQDAGNFTSRLLPGKPAATPLPPIEPQATAAAVPVAPAAAPSATAVTPPPKAETPAKAETKPEPAAKAEKPATKEAVMAKKADDPRAKALLDGSEAAPSAQWVVQLGAYQEAGNVKVLQGKIKELGYPVYTEKVTTPQGPRIRVRAGPFASREAAEKAQARLKKIGAGGPPGGVVAQK